MRKLQSDSVKGRVSGSWSSQLIGGPGGVGLGEGRVPFVGLAASTVEPGIGF